MPVFKLVEQTSGVGDLMREGLVIRQAAYCIDRYQGMMENSGLPIPGLHRIEGVVDLDSTDLTGDSLTLRLETGQSVKVVLVGREVRILSEGHGPGACRCC
ncbi:MAG TPA: hypothetical protein VH701_14325 [Vicinamibacterales bacterium]|jgi:hypothetical protein